MAISLADDRAELAIDTACTPHGQPWDGGEFSKVAHIPTLGVVIATLGTAGLRIEIVRRLSLIVAPAARFETAVCLLEDEIPAAAADLAAEGDEIAAALAGSQTVVVVGWSEALERMAGCIFERTEGQDGFTRRFVRQGLTTYPAIEAPTGCGLAAAVDLARINGMREQPGGPFGGRLVISEITRDAYACRVLSPWTQEARA